MLGLIVAYDRNRVIGNKGCIPWDIEGEKKRFKDLTTFNIIIMGRRTFEEIGRPLPNRITVVVSNSVKDLGEGVYIASSIEEALEISKNLAGGESGDRDIFFVGGYGIYKEGLRYADRLYLTEIDIEVEGDVYFPEIDNDKYRMIYEEKKRGFDKDLGMINFRYLTLERVKLEK